MGDFERTFGAGADAATIVDSFSNQKTGYGYRDDDDEVSAPSERDRAAAIMERAKKSGVRIYWQSQDTALAEKPTAEAPSKPEYFAFDKSTQKNIGRIFRIDRSDPAPYVSFMSDGLTYPKGSETWGWSMYGHASAKIPAFTTNGIAESGPAAEAFMIEAYMQLIEHNAASPRFYARLPLSVDQNIEWQNIDGDPSYSEIFIDDESDNVLSRATLGTVLYAVVSRSPRGDSGSLHRDLTKAIASFSSQFDTMLSITDPKRPEIAKLIFHAIDAMLADDKSSSTIQHQDTEVSITRVLMLGPA